MKLNTVKWAQWDKTQSRELLGLFRCVCIALYTIVAHNIAQNRPDNFPSYPPDNHHCSDDVYLREGGDNDAKKLYLSTVFKQWSCSATVTVLQLTVHSVITNKHSSATHNLQCKQKNSVRTKILFTQPAAYLLMSILKQPFFGDLGCIQLASKIGKCLHAALGCHLMQTSKESFS